MDTLRQNVDWKIGDTIFINIGGVISAKHVAAKAVAGISVDY